jgi:hypothetical protein
LNKALNEGVFAKVIGSVKEKEEKVIIVV